MTLYRQKIIKAATSSLTLPICNIANTMQSKETFPSQLKLAQVTPIFKKNTPLISLYLLCPHTSCLYDLRVIKMMFCSVPIFKKDDPFIPKKYRPVSILPTLSKIYERLLGNQLTVHFNDIIHSYLSAFRTSFGCQTTLLCIVEDWKEALDKTCL